MYILRLKKVIVLRMASNLRCKKNTFESPTFFSLLFSMVARNYCFLSNVSFPMLSHMYLQKQKKTKFATILRIYGRFVAYNIQYSEITVFMFAVFTSTIWLANSIWFIRFFLSYSICQFLLLFYLIRFVSNTAQKHINFYCVVFLMIFKFSSKNSFVSFPLNICSHRAATELQTQTFDMFIEFNLIYEIVDKNNE